MNKLDKQLIHRQNIYKNIDSSFKRHEGIMLSKKIKKKDIHNLSKLVENYIYRSIKIFEPNSKIAKKDFIKKNIDLITRLPNITPGGQIRGIKELIKEYNFIHKELLKIFKKINLLNSLDQLSWFSIRFKKGTENLNYKKRTYSTSKKHSDMWAGEKNHGRLVLMLMGDVKKNTISFYKPIKFSKKAFIFGKKPYDVGIKQIQKTRFIGNAKKGELCLFDQYCLHKSYLLKNAKPRISIDLSVNIAGNKIYSNNKIAKNDERMKLYKKKEWQKLNYKNIKYHSKSAEEIKNLYS